MSGSTLHIHQKALTYHRGLHVAAILTACAVFPLIFVGAGVTSKEAGMAYPDGFKSDGYFLRNPPGWWGRDDTRWEHGHRLVGRTVGLLAIVLAIWCWRCGGAVRILGVCNLLAIIIQGLLGAFRVNEVSTTLAMIHGVMGQMCFCLACCVALITGRTWSRASGTKSAGRIGFLQGLSLAATGSVMIQLVSGAALRHFGFSGALLAHVLGAIVVTFLLGWMAMCVIGQHPGRNLLAGLGRALAILLVFQLLLGGAAFTVTVMGGKWSPFVQWALPSAHVAVGGLLLACSVLVTASTFHPLRRASQLGEPAATAAVKMA